MSRLVTVRVTYQELVGDETYEVWLKHESDPWALNSTGAAALVSGHQDFQLDELVDGDDYVFQVRLKRSGRYRLAYQPVDPGVWPTSSRVAFNAGALDSVGAPTISNGVWTRTAIDHWNTAIDITPDDAAIDLDLYRDGVLINTFVGGAYGAMASYADEAPLAANYIYTARHRDGTLSGPVSDAFAAFSGPPAPEDLLQTSPTTDFGYYTVTWDDLGETTEVEHDFLCPGVFSPLTTTTSGTRTETLESDIIPVNPVQSATFRVRVRNEVTAFTVTDVSNWTQRLVTCSIYAANVDYQSCP
jgi:hypothetical protein